MADNETITGIIKEIRAEADYIEETARGSLKAGETCDGIAYTESDLESALDLAETKRKEADRLESALRRESGDCAKLRDAAKDVARQLRAWAAQIDPFSKDGAAPQRLRALAAKLEGVAK